MYSLVMALALSSTPQAPAFHPKQYPYGWPCLANFCGKDCAYNPYWYSGTHTFYANYYSCFGISLYPQPYIPSAFSGPMGGCPTGYPDMGGMPVGPAMEGPGAGKFVPATRNSSEKMNRPAPGVPTANPAAKPAIKPESTISREKGGTFQAEIVLDIPENATLYVNGTKMKKGAGLRTFTTPALSETSRHFYDLKLEVAREGTIVTTERTVEVKPGKMDLVGLFRRENDLAYSPRRESGSSDGPR